MNISPSEKASIPAQEKTDAASFSFAPPAVGPSRLPTGGLRIRALLVGLPLVCVMSFISVYADMVSRVVQFGVLQFAPPAIAGLFFLALFNRLLTRLFKKEWLAPGDMMVIYSMMLVSVLVSTRGVIEKIIPPLAFLPYFATAGNNWHTQITQHLPAWAVPYVPSANPGRPQAIVEFYEKSKDGSIPLHVWIGPLLCWMALVGCVIWMFACISTLLRRQWMDNEQLRFPLTTLPLAIMKDDVEGQPFFSNKMMWMGFGVAAIVFGINGLAKNYTDWPSFVTVFPVNQFLSERPLNQIDYSAAYISLAAIGFAYFLPTDLLFSLWFFFVLTRFEDVLTVQFGGIPRGIGTHNARIFTGYQAAGAYLVIIATQVRIGWPYFKQVWRTAFGPRDRRPLDDSAELMSYRTALIGLLLGMCGVVLWLALAGMSPWLAFAQMGIYVLIIIVMSRAVAEAGFLMTETSFLPTHVIGLAMPITPLGAQNLTWLGMTNLVFARDVRGALLSPFLDSQKLAGSTGMRQRSLFVPLMLSVVLAYVVGNWFFLHFAYSRGALTLYDWQIKGNVTNMMNVTSSQISGSWEPPDTTAYGGFAVGIVATIFLVYMRANFSWFPFHPLAYAIAPTWAMVALWFPFLMAWIIKSTILRFGGIDTYRRVAPFMLGMILGEFSLAVFWALMNMLFGFNAPEFPWP